MSLCIFEKTDTGIKCKICDSEFKVNVDPAKVKRQCRSRGLGDTIARVTHATGIDSIVKAVTGDCGCGERKEKLNGIVPYTS